MYLTYLIAINIRLKYNTIKGRADPPRCDRVSRFALVRESYPEIMAFAG